jgi:hypothetical protein
MGMIWIRTAIVAVAALAGCAPTVPESGSNGVGFNDYSNYELRQAQARGAQQGYLQGLQPRISDEVVAGAPIPLGTPGAPMSTEATAAMAGAAIDRATLPASAAPGVPLPANPQTAAAQIDPTLPVGMSDEQDFDAVAARESIQSDADRLAENRARYQQVQPTALPERQGSSDTVVIDFALTTTNRVGQKLYDRGNRVSQSRFARACAKFGSQDAAQEEFLNAGGPKRDGRYLDPDGDGFACFWDPEPFRKARLGAVAAPVVREVVPSGDGG